MPNQEVDDDWAASRFIFWSKYSFQAVLGSQQFKSLNLPTNKYEKFMTFKKLT